MWSHLGGRYRKVREGEGVEPPGREIYRKVREGEGVEPPGREIHCTW